MPTVLQGHKLCEQCLRVKPIDQFRRRYRDREDRQSQCRVCHNRTETLRRCKKRFGKNNSLISKFVLGLKNEADDRRVALLCQTMVSAFGSTEEFVQAWREQVEEARSKKPGSKKVLDFFLAVMRMAEYCENQRPKVEYLDDDQLDLAVMRETEDLIRQNPQLAVQCARQIGWTVIPPQLTPLVPLN